MKRRNILSFLLLTVLLLISAGFASWIIVYQFEINPTYKEASLISQYFEDTEVIYNGSIQTPQPKNAPTGMTFTYEYTLKGYNNFLEITSTSGPKNVGEYIIRVTSNNSETCQVKLVIKKKKIVLSNTLIEIDCFKDSNNTEIGVNWSTFQTNVKNQISFVADDGSGTAGLPKDFMIMGMHNGEFYYQTIDEYYNDTLSYAGYSLGTTICNQVIGSTYVANVTLENSIIDNYDFSNNQVIIKYKTAKIGETYYTIEDAINSSGNITLAGNAGSATSYIVTAFTKLSNSDGNPYNKTTFNINGRNLVVPYDSAATITVDDTPDSTTGGNVYSSLYIPDNITLNFSSANLIAAANIGHGGARQLATASCNRGVIVNNGEINIDGSSKVTSYGYIKGNGIINLASGSIATDCMAIYDWPGGSAAAFVTGSLGNNFSRYCVPMNQWSVHNISCDLKINSGAQLLAFVYLILNDAVQKSEVPIVASNSSSTNCLFKPTSSTGYVLKKAANRTGSTALSTISGSNQVYGQRDIVEIHGNYEDATFTINAKISVSVISINASFKNDTSKSLPISYMDITIKPGASLTFTASDYMFLPSSSMTIDKGATLTISNGVDIAIMKLDQFTGHDFQPVDKQDARFILNGTLIVNSGAKIGGTIQSTEEGAVLNVSNGSLISDFGAFCQCSTCAKDCSFTIIKSHTGVYIGSCTANGNISNSAANFANNVYISASQNGEITWIVAANVTTFTLEFYDSDKTTKLETINVYVVNGNTYTITGNEYIPSKMHYNFIEWKYFNGTTISNSGDVTSEPTTKLYANWEEYVYQVSYMFQKVENDITNPENWAPIAETDSKLSISNKLTSFTISSLGSSGLTINTIASYSSGYQFNGWYLGTDTSQDQISSISKDALEAYIAEYGNEEIILYAYFSNIIIYTVNYNIINNDNVTKPAQDKINFGGEIELPTFNDNDSDTSISQYFIGWFTNSNATGDAKRTLSYVECADLADSNNVIQLYTGWNNKYVVTMQYDFAYVNQPTTCKRSYYYSPGQTCKSNELKNKIVNDIPTGFALRDSTIYKDSGFSVSFSDTTINASATYYAKLNLNVTLSYTTKGDNPASAISVGSTNYSGTSSSTQSANFSISGDNNGQTIKITMNNCGSRQTQTTYKLSFSDIEKNPFTNKKVFLGSISSGTSDKTFKINIASTTLDGIIS